EIFDFFFSSRRRHTRFSRDWSSDVCSSDLFNHDGQSDLLIFGNATVIRDKDKEPFKRDEIIIILGDKKRPKKANFPFDYFRNWFTHIRPYPSVVSKDGKDFIEIKYDVYDRRGESKETFYETVFVKNEKLIPYTDQPSTK